MKRTSWQIQKSVLLALFVRDLKTRFEGQLLGIFWTLFDPVAQITILLLIRGALASRSSGPTIDYVVYHTVGMLSFFVFRGNWFRVMDAVRASGGLLSYRQVKPLDTMISRAMLETLINLLVFGILMLGMAWLGLKLIPDNALLFMAGVFLFFAMGFGWGLVSAVISHNRPRVNMFIHLLAFPMYILSGVVMPLSQFPPDIKAILMLNPGAQLVEMVRTGYFNAYTPIQGYDPIYVIKWVFLSVTIGMIMYSLNRERLLEQE